MAALSIFVVLSLCLATHAATVLKGAGATTASRLLGSVIPSLNQKYRVDISYDAIGSGAGRLELINATAEYVFSDVPFTNAEEAKLKKVVKFTLPAALETISVFTFIPSNTQALYFTGKILALIFQRQITTWDHPLILKFNPTLKVPKGQPIFVVRRQDSSGSTNLFSQWLATVAPKTWKLGVSGTLKWPKGTLAGMGSGGVAGVMRSYPYSIGYLGTSVGYGLNLNEAYLPNKAGIYRQAANSDVVASIPRVLPATTAIWSSVTLINADGKQTWPITSFLYSFSRKNVVNLGQSGGLLYAFLRYLNGRPAQSLLASYQFFPLPSQVITKNVNAMKTFVLKKGVKVPF